MNTDYVREVITPRKDVEVTFKYPSGTTVDATFSENEYSSSYEVISEPIPGPRSKWKSFQHYCRMSQAAENLSRFKCYTTTPTISGNLGEASVPAGLLFYPSTYGAPGSLNTGLPEMLDKEMTDGGFVPAPVGVDDLVTDAIRCMSPVIKPDLSIINSLIELKDMKSIPKTVANVQSFASMLKFFHKRKFKGIGPMRTLQQLSQVVSDLYLQHSFNLSPLMSDLSDIYHSLARVEKRLNSLQSRAGRWQTAHYTRTLQEDTNRTELSQFMPLGYGTGQIWQCTRNIPGQVQLERSVYSTPSVFHAELQFRFTYTEFQNEHARLLALLDALGVNFNPAIIWNAIPYTFIIDWVTGVSRWLNDNRLGNMDPRTVIRRFLWSIKRERTVTVRRYVYFGQFSPDNRPAPQVVSLPAVRETAYRRHVGMPSGASLSGSGLSFHEGSLASALVLSRRRRNRRKKN